MRSSVRVLMLGWEYPPRFAGGLGKACQGLSQAMAKQGAQLFFVLPTFPERISESRLEVVGARECLIEAGWDPEQETRSEESSSGIYVMKSQAQLSPYGAHPESPMPERVYRMLHSPGSDPASETFKREKPGSPQPASAQKPMAPTSENAEIYGRNLWTEIERFAYSVRHLAETHEVDIVHAHDWMTFPAAFEFHRVTGVPVFLHVHATEYDRSGENLNNDVFRVEREGFRRATHIFAVSRYTAGIVERLYGVSKKKISVVYNAPEEGASEILASPDAPRKQQVVFLGRLTFQKGPDHFLKAAQLVSQTNPQARFILCGTGDMIDKLRDQAHRLGIESKVHFAGFVDPVGVDQILIASKVLVMPSVSEPFGLVALEAIRCGIPVILSKQSGVREVLSRALQVDFWDHERLADQISAALRLKSLAQQLVTEGWEQLSQLSWEKSGAQILETYKKHLGSTYAQAMMREAHGH